MIWKHLIGALAVALPLGFLVIVGTDAAGATTSVGTATSEGAITLVLPTTGVPQAGDPTTLMGSITCKHGHGTMTFNPPLSKNGNVPTTMAVGGVLLHNCTYQPLIFRGEVVGIGGNIAFTSTVLLPNNNCAATLLPPGGTGSVPSLAGVENWITSTGRPLITPSDPVSFPVGPLGSYASVGAQGKPTFTWADGFVGGGSFFGDIAYARITLDSTAQQLVNRCNKTGGLGPIGFHLPPS